MAMTLAPPSGLNGAEVEWGQGSASASILLPIISVGVDFATWKPGTSSSCGDHRGQEHSTLAAMALDR